MTLVFVAVGSRMVDWQAPLASGFGGGAGLGYGRLAPAEHAGGGGERGHVPPVEAAVVWVGSAGREFGDNAGHTELGDDRLSWQADFLVAEVSGGRADVNLVLLERLTGERGVPVCVVGLRGSAGQGEGAVVLLLDQDPA